MKIPLTLFLAPLAAHAQWSDVSPAGIDYDNWNSVSYGAGAFVSVGANGKIVFSADGLSWTRAALPVSTNWKDIEYGTLSPGVLGFLAVGFNYPNSYVISSIDGVNWIDASATYVPATGGNKFYQQVAIDDLGRLTIPQQDSLADAAYRDGIYLGIRPDFSTNRLYSSVDGVTFSSVGGHPVAGQALVATETGFLIVGTERRDEGGAFTQPYPYIYTTSAGGLDPGSPFNPTPDATGNLTSLIEVDGTYWTVGNSTTATANIFLSTDGTTWARDDVASLDSRNYDLGDITAAGGRLVAVGSGVIITKSLTSIPEPGFLAFSIASLSAIAVAGRRRNRR